MTNQELIHLSNLTSLTINNNHNISNKCIKRLTKLTTLKIQNICPYITQQLVDSLTNLTSLQLFDTSSFTCIEKLTNLVSLDLPYNSIISDYDIEKLTNMTHLGLWNNYKITSNVSKK